MFLKLQHDWSKHYTYDTNPSVRYHCTLKVSEPFATLMPKESSPLCSCQGEQFTVLVQNGSTSLCSGAGEHFALIVPGEGTSLCSFPGEHFASLVQSGNTSLQSFQRMSIMSISSCQKRSSFIHSC